MNGTWKTGFYYGSLKDGFTKLAPFGPAVTATTKARSRRKETALKNGSFNESRRPALRPERQAAGQEGPDA